MPTTLIPIVGGKFVIEPVWIPRPPAMYRTEPSVGSAYSAAFVSKIAAKLWGGDSNQAAKDAVSLIDECKEELSNRLNSFFFWGDHKSFGWERYSVEVVAEIAVGLCAQRNFREAVANALSIIEMSEKVLARPVVSANRSSVSAEDPLPLIKKSNVAKRSRRLKGSILVPIKFKYSWSEAAKEVTGQKRLSRARPIFLTFLKAKSGFDLKNHQSLESWERAIADRKANGFNIGEVGALNARFRDWHPNFVKAQQQLGGKDVGIKNLKIGKKSLK